MPHVEVNKFGPGRYESLVLKTWISKHDGSNKRITGRLEGTYTVYCGEGNEHDFEVKEDIVYWASETGPDTDALLLFEIHNLLTTVDAPYELAGRIVNYALEDWSDPCEVTEL